MTPAIAAFVTKTIEVSTGVDIYIDDVKLNPTDVNGNPVETFIYNGTTYLPVRAVGEAFGQVVQWDGETSSVRIGKFESDEMAVWLKDLDYFFGKSWSTDAAKQDNLGDYYTNAIRFPSNSFDNTYKLNGQYSKMTGTFYQQHYYRSSTQTATLEIYGDGKLLYEAKMTGGVEPLCFDINLTGVLELEIICTNGYYTSLGDCGLWT